MDIIRLQVCLSACHLAFSISANLSAWYWQVTDLVHLCYKHLAFCAKHHIELVELILMVWSGAESWKLKIAALQSLAKV